MIFSTSSSWATPCPLTYELSRPNVWELLRLRNPRPIPSGENSNRLMIRHIMTASVEQPGRISVQLWDQFATCLAPIVGKDGFQALYDRSLHLAAASYVWLPSAGGHFFESGDTPFGGLEDSLQGKPAQEALEACILLLGTFVDILSLLIGEHLTTNLMRVAWGPAFETAQGKI